MPVINARELVRNRVDAIQEYHKNTGISRAELDVSGGIDSAVMAALLVLALGAENCTFVHTSINTNPTQTDRAKRLIQGLGAKLAVLDVTEEYTILVGKIQASLLAAGYDIFAIEQRLAKDPTILGSIRSTLRAPMGRAFNRITGGGIRHGTGNECEDRFLRFYQKGGDGEVDTNPIAMLSKAEVYQLGYELATGPYFGCYEMCPGNGTAYKHLATDPMLETIQAIPSADLWGVGDKHNDESEIANWLGVNFTYGRLDVTTGKVVNVGTIERVSRFLDAPIQNWDVDLYTYQAMVFGDIKDLSDEDFADIAIEANVLDAFNGSGLGLGEIEALLRGARKAERQTWHKHNPNIPTLGSRADLVKVGILSDDFKDYNI